MRFWITYIYREKNAFADNLAKYMRFWITYIYREKYACTDNLAKYMRFWITYIYSASQTQLCCSIKTLHYYTDATTDNTTSKTKVLKVQIKDLTVSTMTS
jgi:hypothetical protein